jgi:hypothetical protein
MTPSNTGAFLIIMFCLIVAFDVYLDRDAIKGNTYSERMRAWGEYWPPFRMLIAFGFGLVAGHWWW